MRVRSVLMRAQKRKALRGKFIMTLRKRLVLSNVYKKMIKEGENTKFSHLKFPSPFFLFFFLSFFGHLMCLLKHPTFNHRSFVKQTRRRTLQRRRRMRTKRRREREDTKDDEIVLSHDVDDDDDDENENDGVTRGRGF